MIERFTGRLYPKDGSPPQRATFWLTPEVKAYCHVEQGSTVYPISMGSGEVLDKWTVAGATYRRLLKMIRKAQEKAQAPSDLG